MSEVSSLSSLEKGLRAAAHQEEMRGQRKRFTKVLLTVFVVLLAILILGGGAVFGMRTVGGSNLKKNVAGQKPNLAGNPNGGISVISENGTEEWQEDWVSYNGKTYRYKEDILTFLVMGVDKNGDVETTDDFASGGQSDAMFLVVCDPTEKHVSCIAVNRDTVVPVKMVGAGLDGSDVTAPAQLTTQYGFGDGGEGSCELVKDAVSELFYGLPIAGYASIRMSAIPIINDSVDGVTVTIPEDMTSVKSSWKEGESVTLHGQEAYSYVRWRDKGTFESARLRLSRQKQFMSGYVVKAKEKTKGDLAYPVNLYNDISEYMVTDLSASEVAYMASEYLGYAFNPNEDVILLEGETKMGEKFEEFYPDENYLQDMMIRVFYEEVQ